MSGTYVKRDYEDGGFFILIYGDFDQGITVRHTSKEMKEIVFEKSIEPEIIQIFDFNIMDALEQNVNYTDSSSTREIRMLSRKDQEFMLDKAIYQESYDLNPIYSTNTSLGIIDTQIPQMIHV